MKTFKQFLLEVPKGLAGFMAGQKWSFKMPHEMEVKITNVMREEFFRTAGKYRHKWNIQEMIEPVPYAAGWDDLVGKTGGILKWFLRARKYKIDGIHLGTLPGILVSIQEDWKRLYDIANRENEGRDYDYDADMENLIIEAVIQTGPEGSGVHVFLILVSQGQPAGRRDMLLGKGRADNIREGCRLIDKWYNKRIGQDAKSKNFPKVLTKFFSMF